MIESTAGHPLFDLIFSHQEVFSNLLKNKDFNNLFNHDSLISLMKLGCIEPKELFDRLTTDDGKVRLINKTELNTIIKNLDVLKLFEEKKLSNAHFIPRSMEFIELLLHKSVGRLFKFESIQTLYFSGELSQEDLFKIIPTKIDNDVLKAMPIGNLKAYLSELFPQKPASPVSVVEFVTLENEPTVRSNSGGRLNFFKPTPHSVTDKPLETSPQLKPGSNKT